MNDSWASAETSSRACVVAHVNLVAFLLTDIEGSSLKWLHHRAAMQKALRAHDATLRNAIAAGSGEVFKTGGDAFYAAFPRPADALGAAVEAQRALAQQDFADVGGLAVRMAVHVGTAERREGDYFGPALNRAARLLSLAHGGQVLVTSSVAELIEAEREQCVQLRRLGAHALDDPLQPVVVHQVDVPGLPNDFPPLRTVENRRTNLPRQPSKLIGRAADLAHLTSLLSQSALVTVTGPGGVGKTRMVLEAGSQHLDRFADGVWLVQLAAISDPLLIASAAMNALGIVSSSGKTPQEALLARLKHSNLLLLLDNCEHLVAAVASLVQAVLAAAPNVRLLVSSQEPLGIDGEQVFRLPSLTVPKEGLIASADAMCAAAVELFVERVKAAEPRFSLDDCNASTVATICRRLDGIPLAIEMAAARAPTLGVNELAKKLDERFAILTGGHRTALPRQQTLRATLDWSYGLLSERHRIVLRRLAVFAGGFTLEAAGRVASDHAIGELEVIDLLSHLVARSLVVTNLEKAGISRYVLLETTRTYALEKLVEAGEVMDITRLHAAFFRDLFERAHSEWHSTTPDVEWRNTYLPERDNLRNALDWAFGPNGDVVTGIDIAGTAVRMWSELSLHSEGRHRMEALAPYADETLLPRIAGRFWLAFGDLFVDIAPRRAAEALARATTFLRHANLLTDLAHALVSYARALTLCPSEFASQSQQAVAEAGLVVERTEAPRVQGLYYITLGHSVSDMAVAREHFQCAVRHFRRAGAERQLLNVRNHLDSLTLIAGDLASAVVDIRETVAQVRSSPISGKVLLADGLGNLAAALVEQGQIDEALAVTREGIPAMRESGFFVLNCDHFALRLAKAGHAGGAARLLGYTDAERIRCNNLRRGELEARARKRLLTILQETMSSADLERCLTEGAKLTEDEAAQLALERGDMCGIAVGGSVSR